MKTIWIVSGGMEAVPGIRRAKEMGLHVVVSDGSDAAPGFVHADHAVIASTYDAEGTAAAARRFSESVRPVDGVICMAADVPATVAAVSAALRLPGIGRETAELAVDKLAMKQHLARAGVPVPWFIRVADPVHLGRLLRDRGFPMVVKPVDSRGARGVTLVTSADDALAAFDEAIAHSGRRTVIAEQFIPGPQISTETLVVDGRCRTLGFIDRNYEHLARFSPHIIENGGEQPTRLSDVERAAVVRTAEAAARAMGIANGVAKGDLVLSRSGPMVIEMAPRLSGGWMSSDQIPLATGVDFVGAAIRVALGEAIAEAALAPDRDVGVAIRYFFPEPGVVTGIRGIEEARASPFVHRLGLTVAVGERVHPITNHTQRAGFVITTGADRREAVARAEEIVSMVRIDTA